MNRRMAWMVVLTLAIAALAYADTAVTGKWTGKTLSGKPLLLDLKAAGETLTGTLTVDKDPVQISSGKVNKNAFSFEARVQDQPRTFKGEVNGDDMQLNVEGIKQPVPLKRTK